MMFLLDTNVISELRKVQSGRSAPEFAAWAHASDEEQHFLSVASILELEIGILRLESKDPTQARILRGWLDDCVLQNFRRRTLPVTLEIARRSSYLLANGTKSYPDSLIAATAYVHNLAVVTRNKTHFAKAGIRVINPWEPS